MAIRYSMEKFSSGLDDALLLKNRAMNDSSMNAEPNSVKRKNLSDAPPLLAAPDADHEVHRQQDDLEEDEEQDEVLGHELPAMPTCRSRISMRNAFVLPGSGMWFQL